MKKVYTRTIEKVEFGYFDYNDECDKWGDPTFCVYVVSQFKIMTFKQRLFSYDWVSNNSFINKNKDSINEYKFMICLLDEVGVKYTSDLIGKTVEIFKDNSWRISQPTPIGGCRGT